MNKQQKSEANRICKEILELYKKLNNVKEQNNNKTPYKKKD